MQASKLLKYGGVMFVPASAFDTVSVAMTYQGLTINLLEASDELPGYLAWFLPAVGTTDTALFVSAPGVDPADAGATPL